MLFAKTLLVAGAVVATQLTAPPAVTTEWIPESSAAAVARVQVATLTLNRGVGAPKSLVKAKGAGFLAGELVALYFDGGRVGSDVVGPNGMFNTRFRVPTGARPGNHPVAAVGLSSSLSAEAIFLVRTDHRRSVSEPAAAEARPPAPYPKTRAALDELVRAGAPGAVVLIRKGGSTTVLAAGVADRRTHRPMQSDDRFRVGSITKSFVATVVLQLVGEQKLSLSETVAKFLPGLLPNGNVITVKELLQHTSGLYDYSMDPRVAAPYLKGNLHYRWTPRRLVAIAVEHGQLFPPGAQWYYSNTNYVVLGLIVEAVTRHSLASELARRILGPLGLHTTGLGADANMGSPAAHGYFKGRDVAPVSFSWAWGAGSMVSTAADVARYYRALFGGTLLHPRQLKQMETTVTGAGGDYGLGLWERPLLCGEAWGHVGETAGYRSFAWSSRDGRRQTVVLATTTSTPAAPEVDAALDALADTAFCAS